MENTRTLYKKELNSFFKANLSSFELVNCICGASYSCSKVFKKDPSFFKLVRCDNCDLTFNALQPSQYLIDTLYVGSSNKSPMKTWSALKEETKEIKRQKEKFALTIEYIKEVNEKSVNKINNVLDVGCGNGWFLYYLKEASPNLKLHGLELNKTAFLKTKEKGLTVFNKSLERFIKGRQFNSFIGSREHGYDFISLWGCLEHLKNPKKALLNAKSLLRINGKILICVPNIDAPEVKEKKENTFMFCPQHFWFWNQKTLDNLLNSMGMTNVFSYGFNNNYQIISIYQKDR